MKILVDRNVVEFTPETPQETSDMEVLWRVVVDCVKDSKKMTPIGEYIPGKSNTAKFVIAGEAWQSLFKGPVGPPFFMCSLFSFPVGGFLFIFR